MNQNNRSCSSAQLLLPIDVELLIDTDADVRLLDQICDQLDLGKLYQTYRRKTKQGHATPTQLFKILVYGYMNKTRSSRALEQACKQNIHYMWLLGGNKPPDHHTLSRFRSHHLKDILEELFYQLVKLLCSQQDITYHHLFVDGTKWEANANRYSFVWGKTVHKHNQRNQQRINILSQYLAATWQLPTLVANEQLRLLEDMMSGHGLVPVHGKGRRKSPLQRDIEHLRTLLEKQREYHNHLHHLKGRNSYSKTDPDATFMRMKEDHMRNGQLKPAYNVQLAVDSEYITGLDISHHRSDNLTLIPLLDRMDKHLGKGAYQTIVADAGYESEQNYVLLEAANRSAYIKPANYEQSKTRRWRNNPYLIQNMTYHEPSDTWYCAASRPLYPVYTTSRTNRQSGYRSLVKVYECKDCNKCSHKTRCTKSSTNRQIQVATEFMKLREQSLQRITSCEGIQLRINRSIQVEGVFGNLKQNWGFKRFLTRGHENVSTEMLLLAIAYNVVKKHHKRQQGRQHQYLHQQKAA